MSRRGRKAWNELYDIMLDHELTPNSYMLKVEVLNVLEKSMPVDCSELDRAIILLIIADSNLSELVEK